MDSNALEVYKDREFIFYPDVDAHDKWNKNIAEIIPNPGQNIEVQDTSVLWKMNNLEVPPKGDCADFFFDHTEIWIDNVLLREIGAFRKLAQPIYEG